MSPCVPVSPLEPGVLFRGRRMLFLKAARPSTCNDKSFSDAFGTPVHCLIKVVLQSWLMYDPPRDGDARGVLVDRKNSQIPLVLHLREQQVPRMIVELVLVVKIRTGPVQHKVHLHLLCSANESR